MKKAIIVIMVILLLLSGCNSGIEKSLKQDSFEKAESLHIAHPTFSGGSYIMLSDWQKYINEKWGLELHIYNKFKTPERLLDDNDNTIVYLNFMDGHIYEYNRSVYKYGNEELAYDLSSYYSKYEWDQFIDPAYIEALTIKGKIYAVPAVNEKYIVPRYYNLEYLTKLNLGVPATIDEFYNYLSETKKMNSNDSTFYPMCVIDRQLLTSTSDIFRAFGVYFNTFFNTATSYEPNTESFENGVFSNNIHEALEFIRMLQDQKLMMVYGNSWYEINEETINVFEEEIFPINKKFATEYNYVSHMSTGSFYPYYFAESVYETVNGYYLQGINTKNLAEVRSDMGFYVFPKSIENIGGVIELFNEVFTNNDYSADLRYGIRDIDYSVIDGNIITNPPKVGSFVNLKQIKPDIYLSTSYVPESLDSINSIPVEFQFEKSIFNQFMTFQDSLFSGTLTHDQLAYVLFNKYLSPEDAVKEYKKEFMIKNGKSAIDELNDKLGKVTAYDYN